jgi:hypothetical protein
MQVIETTTPAVGEVVPTGMPAAAPEASLDQGDQYLDNVAGETIPLGDFIREFGQGLLEQVRMQHPPVYQQGLDHQTPVWHQRQQILSNQAKALRAASRGRTGRREAARGRDEPAAVLNAEMGTGKTMMAICGRSHAAKPSTHAGHLSASPGLQVAARDPRNRAPCSGLGLKWPGHSAQAPEPA